MLPSELSDRMLLTKIVCSMTLLSIVSAACPTNFPTTVGSICLHMSPEKTDYCQAVVKCKERGGELLRGEHNLQQVIQVRHKALIRQRNV